MPLLSPTIVIIILKLVLVSMLIGATLMFFSNLKTNSAKYSFSSGIKAWFYFFLKLIIFILATTASFLILRFIYS